MSEDSGGPKKMYHVIIGTPDEDNCPICQAHAKGRVDQTGDETGSLIRVEELCLSEVLRCPCPLCTQARQEEG